MYNQHTYPSYADFLSQAYENITILVPDARLTTHLVDIYSSLQLQNGKTIWASPTILPLTSFLNTLLANLNASPSLLTDDQALLIWQTIIAETSLGQTLLNLTDTAQRCASAYQLMIDYQIEVKDMRFSEIMDYTVFQTWLKKFNVYLEANNLITAAHIPAFIAKNLSNILLPEKIALISFDEYKPNEKMLLAELAKHVSITHINIDHVIANPKILSFHDKETEYLTLARTAKNLIPKNPQVKIACVFAELEKNRQTIERMFAKLTANVNFVTTKPLAEYAIIKTAMKLLKIFHDKMLSKDFISVAISPFIGESEKEINERASLAHFFEKQNVHAFTLAELIALSIHEVAPSLFARLSTLHLILNTEKNGSYTEWAEYFIAVLNALGFPGERELIDHERELLLALQDVFLEFSLLDNGATTCSLTSALAFLCYLLNKHRLPNKNPDAAIQIMSANHALDLTFDYLFVSGFNENNFPPTPTPYPLIPKTIQEQCKLPHATSNQVIIESEMLLTKLKKVAPICYFTYSTMEEGLEVNVSPLLEHFQQENISNVELADYGSINTLIQQTTHLEKFNDDVAPRLPANTFVKGGADVLKQQAICPFRAFAKHRLQAPERELSSAGFRAKERGIMVHDALDKFWQTLKNQENLNALSADDQDNLITKLIENIFENLNTNYSLLYLTLEKIRMKKLIANWLIVEKMRPSFKVLGTEISQELMIGALKFKLRVDRIDDVFQHQQLIIDYKTTDSKSVHDFFSNRPVEPQLPIYAQLFQEVTTAIAFAQVVPNKPSYKGVSAYELEIKGIKPIKQNWLTQLTEWQLTLTHLSDDFLQGKANVNPKDEKEVCTSCQYQALCRIKEEII